MRTSNAFSIDCLADEQSVNSPAVKCKVDGVGEKEKRERKINERQTSTLPYVHTDGHTQGARLFEEREE